MKKILILGGGISKEREISLETTKQVNSILKKKYRTLISEPNESLKKILKNSNLMLFLMLYMDDMEKMDIFNQF